MTLKKNRGIQERIDEDFKNALHEIRINRIKNGVENDLIPIRELTRMSLNAESWKELKGELERKPRKKNE